MKNTVKDGVPIVIYRSPLLTPFVAAFIFLGYTTLLVVFLFVEPALGYVFTYPVRSVAMIFFVPAIISICLIHKRRARVKSFVKRFKDQNGMICFACSYDLLEGQHTCPECGSKWEPEKLGKGWKKMMGEASD